MVVHWVPGWHCHRGTRVYWKVPWWCIGSQNSTSSSILGLVTERHHSSNRVNWKVPWWFLGYHAGTSTFIVASRCTEGYHGGPRVTMMVLRRKEVILRVTY